MIRLAVESLADLTDRSFTTAIRWIERAGFLFRDATEEGCREFGHPDGSGLWILSTGEVLRLGPKTVGKTHRQRYDQWGKKTALHATGERIPL